MQSSFIYITASDVAEAKAIARELVASRHVACANVYEGVTSFYWWDGEVQESPEAVVIAKTREDLVPALTERVKALHSYQCPCVVALNVTAGNQDFFEWIHTETRITIG